MAATNGRTVTVFGGTGFLGRRIVRHLRSLGFPVRIASRHPDRGHRLFGPDDPQLQSVGANIHDERSVVDALAGAYAVVNAVSLYVEHGQGNVSFRTCRVRRTCSGPSAPGRSQTARSHFGIGADPASQSRYIRTRGEGELVVAAARRRTYHPTGSHVRTGRCVSHYHSQPSPPAPNLSDVRPRRDQIAASLCGRCGGGDCSDHRASRGATGDLRVWWPSRLLLPRNFLESSRTKLDLRPSSSNPACRLARTGMGFRNTPGPTSHAKSGGADGDRYRVIAGDAWLR